MASPDRYDLARFVKAQEGAYASAIAELRAGRKRTHWMWFVFPQLAGLGRSEMARRYAIRDLEEALAYLAHPILGARLAECTSALDAFAGRSVHEIFGSPDDLKFHSSMTLFERAAGSGSVFSAALDRHFSGRRDAATLGLLGASDR